VNQAAVSLQIFARAARRLGRKAQALLIFAVGIAGGIGLYIGADGLYVTLTAASQAFTGPPTLSQLQQLTGPQCGSSVKARPALCINIKIGIAGDSFTVTSLGFAPHTRISLSLLFYAPPGETSPASANLGTFSAPADTTTNLGKFYNIGQYQIMTSTPNGWRISAKFDVLPSIPPS
jgi:hypothetical protein